MMQHVDIDTFAFPLWFAGTANGGSDPSEERGRQPDVGGASLRVLIVEDEFFISLNTEMMLTALGHVVVGIAVSADQAVSMAEKERPDVILMDIRLIGTRDGIDAATEIRNRFDIASIFVTANSDPQTRLRANAARPLIFLEKPLTEQRLRAGLARVGQN
jgi:CheY-like chemotaxis protein